MKNILISISILMSLLSSCASSLESIDSMTDNETKIEKLYISTIKAYCDAIKNRDVKKIGKSYHRYFYLIYELEDGKKIETNKKEDLEIWKDFLKDDRNKVEISFLPPYNIVSYKSVITAKTILVRCLTLDKKTFTTNYNVTITMEQSGKKLLIKRIAIR